MIYFCCDQLRRDAVASRSAVLNGIDFLEVLDHEIDAAAIRQIASARCSSTSSTTLARRRR